VTQLEQDVRAVTNIHPIPKTHQGHKQGTRTVTDTNYNLKTQQRQANTGDNNINPKTQRTPFDDDSDLKTQLMPVNEINSDAHDEPNNNTSATNRNNW
jgi:hypothetical protein